MSEFGRMLGGRNRLITVAIGLIVLAILNSVAYKMPEAGRFVGDWFTVGDILKIAILLIMMGLVLSARDPLTVVATYYARSGFKANRRERMKVSQDVNTLAAEIANVVTIVVLWPIVARVASTFLLLDIEGTFYWVPILVAVVFVAVLLYRLYVGYTALRPVLDVVGVGSSKVPCPQCGTLNWPTAKFCISCGADIHARQDEEGEKQSVRCPLCGAGNELGARFCESCGADIQAAQRQEGEKQSVNCPQCGAENKARAKFCASCGADIQAAQRQEGEKQSVNCPQCGAENEASAKFCASCGASLSKE